jgi:hypothetical protein
VDPSSLANYLTRFSCAESFGLLAFVDAFIPGPEELVLPGIGCASAFVGLPARWRLLASLTR